MDEEYDIVVCGTGFIECVLSGLLSVDGKKVLHIDRNDYYGGESASLNLEQIWRKASKPGKPTESLGKIREYNIDLIPKFIMCQGKLVKILVHTDVTRYLDFKVIDGSFVAKKGKVHKVPVTEKEGMLTGLVGLLDKNRLRLFLGFCQELDINDPKTHKGKDLDKMTMRALLKEFSLGEDTAEFVGHAIALYTDDSFMDRPARECLERMSLYADSLAQFGKSPYIYPMYGLGELPQAFARLAAIYGGTYMLNQPVQEIVYDAEKKFTGVKIQDTVVKAKAIFGDPSYFKDMVTKRGSVVRCICILNHPVANTGNVDSCQIIIPQTQVNRQNDIYVACVSNAHAVAPKGKYIAIVATTVETTNPEKECQPGLDLLNPIEEKFVLVSDLLVPNQSYAAQNVFISPSYDASSHFESACNSIMDLYKQYTGKDVDLTPAKPRENAE